MQSPLLETITAFRPARAWFLSLFLLVPLLLAHAQEAPYFVTYDHHLEEPGNLEIETSTTSGIPRSGQQSFIAPYTEIEYGVTGRWTSELYLEGQATPGDSAVFTGWRIENRFRPLKREHGINPVLYLEYENVNEASRILKEIEGHSEISSESNSQLAATRAHELEGKLILSSDVHDWNIAGNFLATKNFSASDGFEFGYALAVARPLARIASDKRCRFCRENFVAGLEMYGGLGSTLDLSMHETAHYVAPAIGWQISDNSSLRFSTAVGLTHVSNPVLLRFGYSYEIRGFGRKLTQVFGGGR
jgi:hypothetical protein